MNYFKKLLSGITNILRSDKGFSLLELMIVIVIIGILAATVGPKLFRLTDTAKISGAKDQINSLKLSLGTYKLDNGNYPSTEQGLAALIEKPTSEPIPQSYPQNGYLDSKHVPLDPWKHEYVYSCTDSDFTIISYGADGKEGGEGINADISSNDLSK